MKRWIEIIIACAVAGCASAPEQETNLNATPVVEEVTAAQEQEQEPETSIEPRVLYLLMAAELAGQRNQYGLALDGYLQAAKLVDDPRIAERATKIALFLKDAARTEEAADLWLEREPDNLTARRIATLAALRNADKDEAVEHLEASLEQDPAGFEYTLMEMSKIMEKDGKDDFVYGVLDELAIRHPDQADIYYVQALLAARMKNLELAREKNNEVLKIQPDWGKALILQAQLAGQAGDLAEARKYLERALEQAPDDDRLRKMLAQVLVESKAYDDAVTLYQDYLKENPEDGESLFSIALIYLQQDKLDEGEEYLKKLLHDPVWESQASFYLGRVELNRGDNDDALVWFDKVTQGPFVFDSRLAAVSLLMKQKRFVETEKRITDLEQEFPEKALRILLLRAELFSETGLQQDAFDMLTEALQHYPDNRDLLYTRALIAERLDKLDVLEADLQKILQQDPDDAGALNALGYTLVDRTERYDEAETYLQKALRLQPDEAVIIDSYGWLLFKQGKVDQALEYLQRAFDKQPENEIAAHLAEVLWVKGERRQARRLIEDALEDSPEDRYLLEFKKRFLQPEP